MGEKKRLPWRCKSAKQAKDKATIYNSREWKELRLRKLAAVPDCERCRQMGIEAGVLPDGWVRDATCVHHIVPIETAATMEEMRRLAFNYANLMSLCRECHHQIHEEMKSFSRETKLKRAEDRLARWEDTLINQFTKQA